VSLVVLSLLAIGLSTAKGGGLTPSNGDAAAAAGFLAANALWSAVGVGVGVLVRHQVPAIVGGIVWVLVIENLGISFLGDAGPYLPGQLAQALAGTTTSPDSVTAPVAAATLTAYATVALLVGQVIVKRRDVG
jgi:ABC-2 type transport system permease protein